MQLTTLGRGGPAGVPRRARADGHVRDLRRRPTTRRAWPPSGPRWTPGSPCWTPATSTAWGTTSCCSRRVLREVPRDSVFIQVKFGGMRDPRGVFIGHDARPAAVKNFLAYSLTRLGTDYVDLYQPARLDPQVPIEDTVGAIGEMIDAGYVRYLGPVRGRRGDDPAGARGPPGGRAADRVLADEPGHRGRDPAGAAGAGHQRDRLRHPVPRPAQPGHGPSSPPVTRGPASPGSRTGTCSGTWPCWPSWRRSRGSAG